MHHVGWHTTLLNRYCVDHDIEHEKGVVEGIGFRFLAGKKARRGEFNKIIGMLIAWLRLPGILKKNKLASGNYLMISYMPVFFVFMYWLMAKALGYKLVISIMEYHKGIAKRRWEKIKANLFSQPCFSFC